jgi:shikimate dehydrogenase
MISGTTKIAAVIGWPVEHSLSPVIHNAWFRHAGRDWVYVAMAVSPPDLSQAIAGVKALHVAGVSVTMPHKESVIGCLDGVDDLAGALGAVNCIGWKNNRLIGTNTDGDGCCNAIESQSGISLRGQHVAVLGAGGTARSIVVSLMSRGAHVCVVNRSPYRAQELLEMTAAISSTAAGSVRVGEHSDISSCAVVINATSVGMGTQDLPCDPALIAPKSVVMDAVYAPLRTAWLHAAEKNDHITIDGLWMLIHQAALQQAWWFGESPDPLVMRAAAEQELARRRQ